MIWTFGNSYNLAGTGFLYQGSQSLSPGIIIHPGETKLQWLLGRSFHAVDESLCKDKKCISSRYRHPPVKFYPKLDLGSLDYEFCIPLCFGNFLMWNISLSYVDRESYEKKRPLYLATGAFL